MGDALADALARGLAKASDSEPRDDHGRWTNSEGDLTDEAVKAVESHAAEFDKHDQEFAKLHEQMQEHVKQIKALKDKMKLHAAKMDEHASAIEDIDPEEQEASTGAIRGIADAASEYHDTVGSSIRDIKSSGKSFQASRE